MKDFKFFGGEGLGDLGEYLRNYYSQHSDIQIYIGTDSAQHGKVTKYATAVSLLKPGKGVHVVYRKIISPRDRDLFTRLWKETEYTREVADYVHDEMVNVYENKKGDKIPILHLDFNKSPKYKSYMVHDISIGYLKGLGYNVYSKSDSWCASFVSDFLVKN